jgi:outer membrane lipoprotein-sorting protein
MTRRALSILGCLVVVMAGVRLTAQSIDDIVAKNLQAKGGADKLQAVQSMKQTAHVTFQGMTGTITVYGKRPNMVRQEIAVAGQTVVNAFDGTTAWSVNPLNGSSDPTVVTGQQAEDIKMQSDFDSPLVNYKAKGYDLEMVGTETLNGRQVYHLKLTGKNRRVQNLYIDAETSLEARIVGDSSLGPIENDLSDYRDVNGVKMPFLMRTLSSGTVMGQIAVDTIVINPKIDDAIFKMPKS